MTVDKLAGTIATALRGDRPHWRSVYLLFAFFASPALCHPALAIASRVIQNIFARIRHDRVFFDLWTQLCASDKIIAGGLLDACAKAFEVLGIAFHPPFDAELFGTKMCFKDLPPKILARICRIASRQSLFRDFLQSGRQVVSNKGSGILDFEVAPPWDLREPWHADGWSAVTVPSPMTGRLPTGNGLYQAGLLDLTQTDSDFATITTKIFNTFFLIVLVFVILWDPLALFLMINLCCINSWHFSIPTMSA